MRKTASTARVLVFAASLFCAKQPRTRPLNHCRLYEVGLMGQMADDVLGLDATHHFFPL
jgi:hypothetical protein